jgi:hypothetical protein
MEVTVEHHQGVFRCNSFERKKSLFQKLIKFSVFFLKIHPFFNMTFNRVYYNMDNLKINNINVEYDFMFKVHS